MTADVDEDGLEDQNVDANVEKLSGELYDVLFPKLNTGAVTSDLDGPPL